MGLVSVLVIPDVRGPENVTSWLGLPGPASERVSVGALEAEAFGPFGRGRVGRFGHGRDSREVGVLPERYVKRLVHEVALTATGRVDPHGRLTRPVVEIRVQKAIPRKC